MAGMQFTTCPGRDAVLRQVNAGKSNKRMVGSSGGKMIVNSGKWPVVCVGLKECRQTLSSA